MIYLMKSILNITLCISLFLPAVLYSKTEALTKRVAIVIGANNGGKERVRLKYAESDARAFASVLQGLGGVDSKDIHLVTGPSKTKVVHTLERVSGSLHNEKGKYRRVEVVLYYSGHADETGLLLKEEKYLYRDFKKAIEGMNAHVRIAVIDACASGAFTRLKGGKRSAAFLMDESVDMEGYAFLTSNSEDEPAQESDRIKGSYFTHALVSGMRGAADITQDKKVTLNEAYQYAFHETLAKTENTQAGPQHAGYDIQLSGSGEVVMTDLRSTGSLISLEEKLEGRIYIRDKEDKLVMEMKKFKGRQVDIGLEKAEYRVTLEKKGPLLVTQVDLTKKSVVILHEGLFKPTERVATVSRGGTRVYDSVEYDTLPVHFGLIPNFSKKNGKVHYAHFFHNYTFDLLIGGYGSLRGFGVSLIGQFSKDQVHGGQASGFFNVANYLKGGQGAGFFNVAHQVEGVQGAGFFNVSKEIKGGQGAGFFNISQKVHGGQGSGFFNVAREIQGGQGSGFFNVSRNIHGGQGTGFFNAARDIKGIQGSGFFNVARDVHGGQGAGFFNGAKSVRGIQGAGFFNVALDVDGAQMAGFFNIGRDVKGFQVGLVNLARQVEGETIGVLNLNKNTQFHPTLWMDEAGFSQLGLKTGTGLFYGLVNAGVRNWDLDGFRRMYTYGFGVGIEKIVNRVIFQGDVSENQVLYETKNSLDWGYRYTRLKLGAGYKFAEHFRLVGGATLNVGHYFNDESYYQDYIETVSLSKKWDLEMWPGFYTAVEF